MDNESDLAEKNALQTEASYSHNALTGGRKDSSCTVRNTPGSVTGYKNVSTNSEKTLAVNSGTATCVHHRSGYKNVSSNSAQTLMSEQQTMSITVEADQPSFQPCSRGRDQGEGHDAIFAKRHGAQAKERDVRIDLLTAGTCVSLMMQDSQRSGEIALWRRRDGENGHSSHSAYSERTRKPRSGMTRDEDADN